MTISALAGATLVVGCTLLLGGPSSSSAFVTPPAAALAGNHRRPAPASSRGAAVAATTTATATVTAATTRPGGARGRRRRSRAANGLLPGSGSGGGRGLGGSSQLGAGPLLMSSGGDGGKDSGEQKATEDGDKGPAAPVDAELSEPAVSTSGGNDGGGGGGGAPEGEGGGGDASAETGDPATREALKQKLLRKVATLNRGFLAQEADRLDVEEIVEMLEMENPSPKPCEAFADGSSPLAGRWQLLYTTSLDVLSLEINPTVTVGKIFQEIEPDGRAIQNIIELQPPFAAVNKILGSSMATLTVKLETEPVSDSRINLKFVRTEIKADSLFGRKLDLPTLGVDLPSAEKLENILPKKGSGGGGGGVGVGVGGGLKSKLEDTKSKAQALARKAKDKRKNLKNAVEEKISGGSASSAKGEAGGTGGGDDVSEPKDGSAAQSVVDVETLEEEEEEEKGEESMGEKGGGGEEEESSGGGEDGEKESAAPASSASLLRAPYFESTYCDGDLRVGRTGKGDMFVSIRA